jgi:hypothetical protein
MVKRSLLYIFNLAFVQEQYLARLCFFRLKKFNNYEEVKMEQNKIELTTPEMTALWTIYIQSTAIVCFFQHFKTYIQDAEIKPIVEEALQLSSNYINETKDIFIKDRFPIPKGFSEKDVDLSAPPLFTDLYALSFVYRIGQMNVEYYAKTLTKVARSDIVQLFDNALYTTTQLYKKSLNLMLSKGIYDRPPKIPYPHKVEYIEKDQSLLELWLGEKRPMNAMELGEIFYTIERNYIGIILLIGLIQVTKDKEIKDYLIRGKQLAMKQIETFNKVLEKEEHIGNIPVTMEVTDSTVSPFSNRLSLFIISTTTTIGTQLLGYSMSVSIRKDITTHYVKLIFEVMKYGSEGLDLLIKRGWMEQPPQSINRIT